MIGSHVMTKYGDGVVFQTNGDHVWVWLRDLDASPYSSVYVRTCDVIFL